MADEEYRCEHCGEVFTKTRTDAEANAEAAAVFGVREASTRNDMAIVCDDCYRRMAAYFGWNRAS